MTVGGEEGEGEEVGGEKRKEMLWESNDEEGRNG